MSIADIRQSPFVRANRSGKKIKDFVKIDPEPTWSQEWPWPRGYLHRFATDLWSVRSCCAPYNNDYALNRAFANLMSDMVDVGDRAYRAFGVCRLELEGKLAVIIPQDAVRVRNGKIYRPGNTSHPHFWNANENLNSFHEKRVAGPVGAHGDRIVQRLAHHLVGRATKRRRTDTATSRGPSAASGLIDSGTIHCSSSPHSVSSVRQQDRPLEPSSTNTRYSPPLSSPVTPSQSASEASDVLASYSDASVREVFWGIRRCDLMIGARLRYFDEGVNAWTTYFCSLCVGGGKYHDISPDTQVRSLKVKEVLAQTCWSLLETWETGGTWMGFVVVKTGFGRVCVIAPALLKTEGTISTGRQDPEVENATIFALEVPNDLRPALIRDYPTFSSLMDADCDTLDQILPMNLDKGGSPHGRVDWDHEVLSRIWRFFETAYNLVADHPLSAPLECLPCPSSDSPAALYIRTLIENTGQDLWRGSNLDIGGTVPSKRKMEQQEGTTESSEHSVAKHIRTTLLPKLASLETSTDPVVLPNETSTSPEQGVGIANDVVDEASTVVQSQSGCPSSDTPSPHPLDWIRQWSEMVEPVYAHEIPKSPSPEPHEEDCSARMVYLTSEEMDCFVAPRAAREEVVANGDGDQLA